MTEPEHLERLHTFVRNADPTGWMGYADELRDAAELLWSHPDKGRIVSMTASGGESEPAPIDKPSVSRTFILLTGLALENLLKGLAVAKNPNLVNAGSLGQEIKSHRIHDLVELCEDVGLSPEETRMCQVAQDAIPNWGRYPVPLKYTAMKSEVIADLDYKVVFDNLFNRLHKQLYFLIRDGWDSRVGLKLTSHRSSIYEEDMKGEPGSKFEK